MLDVLLIVLPLTVVIVIVAVVAFFLARRTKGSKGSNKKTKQLIDSYIQERAKEHTSLTKELAHLDRLLSEKQIDKETYDRLKNVLVTMKGKKSMDADDLFTYVAEKKEPKKE